MRRLPRHHATAPWQRQRPRRRLPGVHGDSVHTHDADYHDATDDHDDLAAIDNHDDHGHHKHDNVNEPLPQRDTRLRRPDENGLYLRGRLHQSILRPQRGVAGALCPRVRRLDGPVRV